MYRQARFSDEGTEVQHRSGAWPLLPVSPHAEGQNEDSVDRQPPALCPESGHLREGILPSKTICMWI